MVEVLRQRLTDDDDPELWDAVIRVLTEDVLRRRTRESDAKADWFFQIGACSHWARPHQTRWPAAGGFAWPSGYKGGAGHGYGGLPEFNWSVTFRLFNSDWEFVEKFAGRHNAASAWRCPPARAVIGKRPFIPPGCRGTSGCSMDFEQDPMAGSA